VVGVHQSDDNTLEVAQKYADVVLQDQHHGRGDPTIHLAAKRVQTKYSFVISDDEWPDEELLNSFQDLVGELRSKKKQGAWVKFNSFIDGFDFTRDDHHLRFWESHIDWPGTPHARPMTSSTIRWDVGQVAHTRSLDEMMRDYIRRYDVSNNPGWEGIQAHNIRMMEQATKKIAERKGWEYVKSYDWWPRIRDLAWNGEEQSDPESTEEPTGVPSPVEGASVEPQPAPPPSPPRRRPGRPRGTKNKPKT
jgi:hypothetical protein